MPKRPKLYKCYQPDEKFDCVLPILVLYLIPNHSRVEKILQNQKNNFTVPNELELPSVPWLDPNQISDPLCQSMHYGKGVTFRGRSLAERNMSPGTSSQKHTGNSQRTSKLI